MIIARKRAKNSNLTEKFLAKEKKKKKKKRNMKEKSSLLMQ